MAYRKRKDLASIRRRVEDDGDKEGGPDVRILDDDSSSEDSIQEDNINDPEDNESQNSGYVSSSVPQPGEILSRKRLEQRKLDETRTSNNQDISNSRAVSESNGDLHMMLNGLSLPEDVKVVDGVHFDELGKDDRNYHSSTTVRSNPRENHLFEKLQDKRKREHEEYKKKRLEDPAFVPNRGSFFMHDHRHSGPTINGCRSFARVRGRGKLGSGNNFAHNSLNHSHDPSDVPWAHDMHDIITQPVLNNSTQDHPQHKPNLHSQATDSPLKDEPIGRSLSVTKSLGTVQIRVALPLMLKPINFSGTSLNQYTRLPDHRPPLRRDKPVRVSLPDHQTKYIYPTIDRSFIFIPRALRPNQQGFGGRGRGRGRSVFGSGGGYSRRTSVFGGSIYGSAHSPSVAMSRRSSLAYDINRETLSSPTGSVISRHQTVVSSSKPVVRLPPSIQDSHPSRLDSSSLRPEEPSPIRETSLNYDQTPKKCDQNGSMVTQNSDDNSKLPLPNSVSLESTLNDHHPKVTNNQQPKSQESITTFDFKSPSKAYFDPRLQYKPPLHNQAPAQVNTSNYSNDGILHSRDFFFPLQSSTRIPLSRIPERAIHAQAFQPNPYQSQQQFYLHPYQVMPQQHSYYYPPTYNSALSTPNNVPAYIQVPPQQSQHLPLPQTSQTENPLPQAGVQSLISQEINGMVYYYDPAQIPAIATYPAYQHQSSYPIQQVGTVGMGVIAPNPEGYYYASTPQEIVYHPQ
ncbi:hypothetical protein OnM2_098017 [Erysiphe neolycopersici]|uniref:Btz domain-containing protein n=1 Tax=Erysiphe neolycopersici TaxID=212602 RepID=A0A420HA35_9PEZI|nr:hypothetical protein OnM2_098017 [Erysiphe neolycopersici]